MVRTSEPSQERDALLSPLVLLVRGRVLIPRSSRGASSVWHKKKHQQREKKRNPPIKWSVVNYDNYGKLLFYMFLV